MRHLWMALVLCIAPGVLSLAEASEPVASIYATRRAELRKALPNGIVVLFGRSESDSDDLRSGFFQEPNFYYLSGWKQPGAVIVIEPARDILFLPAKDPEAEKWTGVKASADDPNAAAVSGFEAVMPVPKLEAELLKLLAQHPRLYTLRGSAGWAKLEKLAPLREVLDARGQIARQSM